MNRSYRQKEYVGFEPSSFDISFTSEAKMRPPPRLEPNILRAILPFFLLLPLSPSILPLYPLIRLLDARKMGYEERIKNALVSLGVRTNMEIISNRNVIASAVSIGRVREKVVQENFVIIDKNS